MCPRNSRIPTLLRVFGFISWLIVLLHTLRLLFGWEVSVSGWLLPIWVSWVGIMLFGYLGYVAIGWKLFWPLSFIAGEVVGWWRAYRESPAKDKLQFITAVSLIVTLFITIWSALLQRRSVYLDTRPYVQLTFNGPDFYDADTVKENGKVKIHGTLKYHNHGKVPSVNMRTSFYISTDKDYGNRAREFYRRDSGILRTVSSLESGGEDYVDGSGLFTAAMEFYYVDVVVSYEGVDKGRRYWSRLTKTFRVVDRDGHKDMIEVRGAADWDREQPRRVPEPSLPGFRTFMKETKGKERETVPGSVGTG